MLLTDSEFSQVARDMGYGAPPEYPHSDHWTRLDGQLDLTRYWSYPDDGAAPSFARALLSVSGPADCCWIRPSRGRWFDRLRPREGWSDIWDTLVAALGVPRNHVGAVGFATGDPRLEAVITLQLVMGTSLLHDAIVLPSHGEHLWFFEHHNVVWGEFADPACLARHVRTLEAAGYPLPEEPPDSTFKPQPWQL